MDSAGLAIGAFGALLLVNADGTVSSPLPSSEAEAYVVRVWPSTGPTVWPPHSTDDIGWVKVLYERLFASQPVSPTAELPVTPHVDNLSMPDPGVAGLTERQRLAASVKSPHYSLSRRDRIYELAGPSFFDTEMALSRAAAGLNANVHQGYFAEALVASIAAAAGLDVQFPRLGHVIDLGIFKPGPNGTSGSRQINLQVKSWSTGVLSSDDNFHYPLEVPAFNQLAGAGHDVRHYLVLCVVPDAAADYSDAQHHRLRLQRAAYWLSLRNETPDSTLNPDSTKTVLVPRINLLTASTIQALVDNQEHLAVVS